jgi:predicted RNA-binding Zn ribbon-like protein
MRQAQELGSSGDSAEATSGLCLKFVNSEWYDGWGRLEERLNSPAWRRDFLSTEFPGLRLDAPTPAVMKLLSRLRSVLREMIERVAGGSEPTATQLQILNSFLARCTWKYSVTVPGETFHLTRVPQQQSWNWVMSAVAASACELFSRDTRRIKICPNQGCRWVFYDTTKGRTRRWCTASLCGNLYKVRRYRARRKLQRRRS